MPSRAAPPVPPVRDGREFGAARRARAFLPASHPDPSRALAEHQALAQLRPAIAILRGVADAAIRDGRNVRAMQLLTLARQLERICG